MIYFFIDVARPILTHVYKKIVRYLNFNFTKSVHKRQEQL